MNSNQGSPSNDSYKVNSSVGKSPGFGILPTEQIFPWIVIYCIALLAWVLHFPGLTFIRAFIYATIAGLAYWWLTGSRPYQFWDMVRALPLFQKTWFRARVPVNWNENTGLPEKAHIGDKKVSISSQKPEKLSPIEDCFDLVCYGEMRIQAMNVGFRLLRNRKTGELRFVFEWQLQGVHPQLSESKAKAYIANLRKGLPEFPQGETFTVVQTSYTTDEDAQSDYDRQLEKTDNPLVQALIVSKKVRTRELKKRSFRRVQTVLVRATYSPSLARAEDSDLLSQGIKRILSAWETLAGEKEELDHKRLTKIVSLAFSEGFLRWHSILTNIMLLEAQPYTAVESWQEDYQVLHKSSAPPIPQLLILESQGLRTEISDPHLHATTVLLQGDRGKSTVPIRNPEWVYLPAQGVYEGFMQIDRPNTFVSAKDMALFLWKVIAKERAYDCRIVTEYSVANRAYQKFNLERLTRNSNTMSERALLDKDVNVVAEGRVKESVQARKALEEGDNIMLVGSGIFLRRRNPQALDHDFSGLKDCFPGTEPYREQNITPRIWLQSLPWTWEGFLQAPSDRRDHYLSRDAAGLIDAVTTRPIDKQGVELICLEGGTPIFLDAFSPDKHLRLAIFGQPRTGKSIFQAEWVVQAFIRGYPVVGFDFPRPNDGSSTYQDLVNRIAECGGRAFYYDIGKFSNNMLHMPDFSGLDDPRERRQEVINFQINATVIIAIGDISDPLLEQSVRALVTQSLVDFHAQQEIVERYQAANRAGIGTPEWEATPTYYDYLEFLKVWLKEHLEINTLTPSNTQKEAASLLVEQLKACLKGPLGRAIARPSSFPPNTDLLIFSLRNLSSSYEAAVLALAGYSALLNRALTSDISFFFTDESPILFRFPAISRIVGQLCANGGKWGVRVILSGQDSRTIYESDAGKQIYGTLNAKMVTYIDSADKQSFVDQLGLDSEMLERCCNGQFRPSSSALRSHWLLNINDQYYVCAHYPSELLLSLTANNPDEAAARKRITSQYSNPVEGMIAFSQHYIQARRSGTPINEIGLSSDRSRHLKALP